VIHSKKLLFSSMLAKNLAVFRTWFFNGII